MAMKLKRGDKVKVPGNARVYTVRGPAKNGRIALYGPGWAARSAPSCSSASARTPRRR
jgi:hypothetical protein